MDDALRPLHDWLTANVDSPLLSALLVVVAAVIAGKLMHLVLTGILRPWARRTKSNLDDQLLRYLQRPIVLTVLLFGLYVASGRFELQLGQQLLITRTLQTGALLVWTWFVTRLCSMLLRHASENRDRYRVVETRTFPLFENLSKVLVVVGFVYFMLKIWQVDATGWVTSAGIAGIAVGFAAKDTLANLFAGVSIVADAPYTIGDYIVLGDVRGKVVNIGLRSTRIMTRDDVEITVPNAVIGTSQIVNQSGGGDARMRVRVKVSVSYDADIDRVRELLLQLADAEPHACSDPEPRVRFRRFGDSGLDFELLIWVEAPELRGRTLDTINSAILKTFREAGIEIPYPKRDVYLHQS